MPLPVPAAQEEYGERRVRRQEASGTRTIQAWEEPRPREEQAKETVKRESGSRKREWEAGGTGNKDDKKQDRIDVKTEQCSLGGKFEPAEKAAGMKTMVLVNSEALLLMKSKPGQEFLINLERNHGTQIQFKQMSNKCWSLTIIGKNMKNAGSTKNSIILKLKSNDLSVTNEDAKLLSPMLAKIREATGSGICIKGRSGDERRAVLVLGSRKSRGRAKALIKEIIRHKTRR
jgi:hypothetical protein